MHSKSIPALNGCLKILPATSHLPLNIGLYLCNSQSGVINDCQPFFCVTFYTLLSLSKQGTTRPTHYHVLLDEVGFSADELQELVHNLSYV